MSKRKKGPKICHPGDTQELSQCARKFKKVQAKKNSSNQINQFHEKIFDQISIFAISKMTKNSIFELRKTLKLPKMQLHEIFLLNFHEKYDVFCFCQIDSFDFTRFFFWPGLFLNFLWNQFQKLLLSSKKNSSLKKTNY